MPDKVLKADYSCAMTRFWAFLSHIQHIFLAECCGHIFEMADLRCKGLSVGYGGHSGMSLVRNFMEMEQMGLGLENNKI